MIAEVQKTCECGCGMPTKKVDRNTPKKGLRKGVDYRRFIHGHNQRGELNNNWKGGKRKRKNYGYIDSLSSRQKSNRDRRRVSEHRIIAEKILGKKLPKKAVIHHADNKGGNNSLGNLVICEDSRYHSLLHKRQRAYFACGHANWLKCPYCKKYDDPRNMYVRECFGRITNHHHQSCSNQYQRDSRRNKNRRGECSNPLCPKRRNG